MKQIGLRWPEPMIERIDAVRGIASRSAWIRQAVEEKLAKTPAPTTPQVEAMFERLKEKPREWLHPLPTGHTCEWQYDPNLGEDRCIKCGEVKE